jgi:hypothetical protein
VQFCETSKFQGNIPLLSIGSKRSETRNQYIKHVACYKFYAFLFLDLFFDPKGEGVMCIRNIC